MNRSRTERALPWLLLLYCAASLLHFVHNAEYISDYPGLPDWLSRSRVYVAWLAISAIGVVGYALCRRGHRLTGLIVLTVYAGFGFDGLLHYTLAPFAAHTIAMNLTIWFEIVAATLLFVTVIRLAIDRAWSAATCEAGRPKRQ
jgi:hypothetical protein